MPTLKEIWQQIEKIPHKYIFYTRKEIRYLPQILAADERVLALTSGFMDGHTWLCVCTNKRVLFLDRGMFFGLRQVQMNLDRIQSIDSSYTLVFGRIRLWDGASSVSVNLVLKSTIAPFVRTVQEAMDRYKREMAHDIANNVRAAHASGSAASTPSSPWLGELERLSKLKNEGHLSEAEYVAAKTKLLSS